jgi:hypothetical protein
MGRSPRKSRADDKEGQEMKRTKTEATGEQTPELTPDETVPAIMAGLTPHQANRIDALLPKARERAAGPKLKATLSDERELTISLSQKNKTAADLLSKRRPQPIELICS